MPTLFIVQLALIIVAVASFFLWVWSVSTDPDARGVVVKGEQVVESRRASAFIFFVALAGSLWLLYQTQFDLCGFMRFWWPGMPPDVFGFSCVVLPKIQ